MAAALADLAERLVQRHGLTSMDDVVSKMHQHLGKDVVPEDQIVGAIQATRQGKRRGKRIEKLKGGIAQAQKEAAEGLFAPTGPRSNRGFGDKEIERLQFEYDRARSQRRARLDDIQKRTIYERMKDFAAAPRSVMASMDLSAVGRQGGFIALGNPVRATRAMGDMFRAFASEDRAIKLDRKIADRANAPIYKKAGLYIAPVDKYGPLAKREEAFMSRFAEKLPVVGRAVKASDRAYAAFLNRLRADTFDTMAATLAKNGEPTLDEIKAIGNYINVATGRGDLYKFNAAAEGLAQIFFSPRYVASRFELLAGQPLYGGSMRTRAMIGKEYAKFGIGAATALGLMSIAGATVEDDARSSDFLKGVFGKARVDVTAGLSQVATLAKRLKTGETKRADGQITKTRGPTNELAQFARRKLAPIPAAILNAREGKNVIGEPTDAKQEAIRLALPISGQNIVEILKEYGVSEKGVAFAIAELLGFSVNVYGDKKKAKSSPYEVGARSGRESRERR